MTRENSKLFLIGTARSENHILLKKYGYKFLVDPSVEDLNSVVMRFTKQSGVDIIFKGNGVFISKRIEMLRQGGKIILYGKSKPEVFF